MTLPRATRGQLVPLVEQALARDRAPVDPLLVVRADPSALPTVGEVGGRAVTVVGSSSPLEIRRIVGHDGRVGPLVVLTDCEPGALGDDLLARADRHKVLHIDRWTTVCQLFGAERPTGDLARKPHLADALIEAAPAAGYPRLANRVLDLETATAALVRASVGLGDDVVNLAGLLRWLDRPDAVGRLAEARGQLFDDLLPSLRSRFGDGVHAVLAALAAGRASDLVPLGVVAGIVHTPPADDLAAVVRLDERLGGGGVDGSAHRAWGSAAVDVVLATDDPGRAAGWVERAATLLRELGADAQAHRSDLLPAGFEQRVRLAAESIVRWRADPTSPSLGDDAQRAVERVAAHHANRRAPERVERLRMAARLVRRGDFSLGGFSDLSEAATAYELDGAWLDAARTVVSRGDTDVVFARLCAELSAAADAAREADGLRFAQVAGRAADAVPSPLVGVEDVLDEVVVPLAGIRPVLVVVLDGMGWPTFTELAGAFEGSGWVPWRRPGSHTCQVAVATLPTVTERSRTSLLSGRLRTGDAESERRAFAAHAGLLTVTRSGPPPTLFHKRALREGGLDTLPEGVLDVVGDERHRVVGIVINNIDERLKDVAQPGDGWELRDLDPLRHVLDAARRAGRAVVVTADHGHVLDRDAEHRPAGGGGERWRLAEPPAGDGEVLVQGRRVVTDDQRAVLPWREQLHYGTRRNGYHGGITPKELLVPLVVLSTEDLPEDSGWAPSGLRRPAWWHHTQLHPQVQQGAPAPVTPAETSAAPTLFDPAPPVPTVGATPAWIEALLVSPLLLERRANPRVRLGEPELRRLLGVLDRAGTMALGLRRLATEADLPVARIDRFVAQLQELLNVEGYGVVTTSGDEVRFDRALLERQFSL